MDQVLGQPQCHRTQYNPMDFLLMAEAELPLAELSITEGRTRAPVPLSAVTGEAQHSGGAVTPRRSGLSHCPSTDRTGKETSELSYKLRRP